MSEYVREIKIDVEVDTNKTTTKVSFNNYFEAVQWLWDKLTDEKRAELAICKRSGSLGCVLK